MSVFSLQALPYDLNGLAPYISAETLDFHYNKHHKGYLTKLNAAAENTPLKDLSLEEIILNKGKHEHVSQAVYNSAAQTWNHTFYWSSMAPPSEGQSGHREPTGALKDAIVKDFGSYDAFKKKFSDVAAGHFASGWAWLVKEKGSGTLKIVDTHDAGCAIESTLFSFL